MKSPERRTVRVLTVSKMPETLARTNGAGLAPYRISPGQVSFAARKRLFVLAYVAGGEGVAGNAIESARTAGYRGSNEVLAVTGCRLLKHPDVIEAVDRLIEAATADAVRITRELGYMAFSSARDVDAALTALRTGRMQDLPDHVAAAIGTVEVHEGEHGTTYRVKAHDKAGPLGLLAKLRGLVKERHGHSGPGGGPIPVDAVVFYVPASRRVVEVVESGSSPAKALASGTPARREETP
jgi:hypothetical protein